MYTYLHRYFHIYIYIIIYVDFKHMRSFGVLQRLTCPKIMVDPWLPCEANFFHWHLTDDQSWRLPLGFGFFPWERPNEKCEFPPFLRTKLTKLVGFRVEIVKLDHENDSSSQGRGQSKGTPHLVDEISKNVTTSSDVKTSTRQIGRSKSSISFLVPIKIY